MRIAAFVGLILVFATLVPLSPAEAWWVRAFDYPRLQLWVLLIGWLAVAFALRMHRWPFGRVVMIGAMACAAYLSYRIYPYTPLSPKRTLDSVAPRAGSSVRLLFANVLQTNRNADEFLRIVAEADPDVVLTLETDVWWSRQLARLKPRYPHVVLQPQQNTYGMLLHSRFPLVDTDVRFVVQRDVPSIHAKVRLPSGVLLDLYCVHPRPPYPSESTETTPRDAELVLLGREVRGQAGPLVVMGDFNDVAWSETSQLFVRTSRLLDPRVGRGFYTTFPATVPLFRFPLDHVFHSDDLRLVELKRLRKFGSDHFPMFIHLSYEPQAEGVQEAPRPEPGDTEKGREKIRRAR